MLSALNAGALTSMALLPVSALPKTVKRQSRNSWHLMTGHTSGDVELWAAQQHLPLQSLAVLEAQVSSPVRSLLSLDEQQLLCFAHANGQLTLYNKPDGNSLTRTAAGKVGLLQLELQLGPLAELKHCIWWHMGLLTLDSAGAIFLLSEQHVGIAAQHSSMLFKRYLCIYAKPEA